MTKRKDTPPAAEGTKDKPRPLLDVLEDAVRKVLADENSTRRDKLAAIEAGGKLLAIRHRVSGDGAEGAWFNKG